VRVITADGRSVAVAGHGVSTAAAQPWSGAGSVRLVDVTSGRRRTVRYAEIGRVNPWVRSAIDARSSPGSRVPMHVFRPLPPEDHATRGDRERVRPGDAGPGVRLARLMASPAPGMSGRRFRRRLLNDVHTHANAFIEKVYAGGQLVELAWHPWVDVAPVPSSDGLSIEAWQVPVDRRDGLWLLGRDLAGVEKRTIDAADAIHIVAVDDVDPDPTTGPLGVSPLASLHATHALHDAAMRFATAYMGKGIFPAGVVELHPQATPGAAAATREVLEALHAGVDNAGRPVALAGKWQQIMATPEGAKLVELAEYSKSEVAAAYQTHLLGEMTNANRASAQTAREVFVRDVVGDDVAVLESEFNAQLVAGNRRWSEAGLWVEGELAELLRPDLPARAKVYAQSKHWITTNEIRRRENLPPIDEEWANVPLRDPGTPGAGDLDDETDDQAEF
jgi:HK97 family phage portal protein